MDNLNMIIPIPNNIEVYENSLSVDSGTISEFCEDDLFKLKENIINRLLKIKFESYLTFFEKVNE